MDEKQRDVESGDAADHPRDAADAPGSATRRLGVVEAMVAARDQCPSGAVRGVAAAALDALARGGREELRRQATVVLAAVRGWRGDRARQVQESLQSFLEESGTGAE